jgi:type IV pilus assembly protein PilB
MPSVQLVGERHRETLETILREVSLYVHGGCPRCHGTGYSGKMALFDLLPFTPGVQGLLLSDAPFEERISRIVEENLRSVFPSVEDLLRRGMVTIDDVLPFFR